MVQPFFSIVIPAYNAERFMTECLDSVLKQTFKDYEILIVDNGSVDNTSKISESILHDKNVNYSVLRTEKNLGIGGGRNMGIKAAKGGYVAFLDADDVWYPKKLERVHEVLSKNENIGLVCHDENLVMVGDSNKIIGKMVCGTNATDMFDYLLFEKNCILLSATIVKTDKLTEVGFFSSNPDFYGVEDYELWLRLSKICRFHFIHEILGEYRLFGRQNTSANFNRQIESELNIIKHHFSTLDPDKQKKELGRLKKRQAYIYCGTGWSLHRRGEFTECRDWYVKAMKKDPLLYKSYAAYLLSVLRIKW